MVSRHIAQALVFCFLLDAVLCNLGVVPLTEDSFDAVVHSPAARNGLILVNFHVPGSGRSTRFIPEFQKLASLLAAAQTPITFATVDCRRSPSLQKRYGIVDFPTIVAFQGGRGKEYTGDLNAKDIIFYVLSKLADAHGATVPAPPHDVYHQTATRASPTPASAPAVPTNTDDSLMKFTIDPSSGTAKLSPPSAAGGDGSQPNSAGESDTNGAFFAMGGSGNEGGSIMDFMVGSGDPQKDKETDEFIEEMLNLHFSQHFSAEGKVGAIPVVATLETTEQVQKFFETEDTTVVGFFRNDEGGEEGGESEEKDDSRLAFQKVAMVMSDKFAFGEVVNDTLANELGRGEDIPSVLILKNNGQTEYLKGPLEHEDLLEFVREKGTVLMVEMTHQNKDEVLANNIPVLIVRIPRDSELLPELEAVAREHQGVIQFVFLPLESKVEIPLFDVLVGEGEAGAAILDATNNRKYQMPSPPGPNVSAKGVAFFAASFRAGAATPFVRSGSTGDGTDAALTLVANTFRDNVYRKGQDALVLFHAPWCPHCQQFLPVYEKVAEKLSDVKSILVAKIDVEHNDLEREVVNLIDGLPTVLLFRSGSKGSPIQYPNSRNVRAILKWVQSNVSIPFEPIELPPPKADAPPTDGRESPEEVAKKRLGALAAKE